MFLFSNSERSRKMRAYRTIRSQLEQLSEGDLADMGLKRYQLGHIARVQALSNG